MLVVIGVTTPIRNNMTEWTNQDDVYGVYFSLEFFLYLWFVNRSRGFPGYY